MMNISSNPVYFSNRGSTPGDSLSDTESGLKFNHNNSHITGHEYDSNQYNPDLNNKGNITPSEDVQMAAEALEALRGFSTAPRPTESLASVSITSNIHRNSVELPPLSSLTRLLNNPLPSPSYQHHLPESASSDWVSFAESSQDQSQPQQPSPTSSSGLSFSHAPNSISGSLANNSLVNSSTNSNLRILVSPVRTRHTPYHSRTNSALTSPTKTHINNTNINNSISSSDTNPDVPSTSNSSGSFLTKVSSNALVCSAVKVYESGKSFSPRFKYSAEKLESVVLGSNSGSNSGSNNSTPLQDSTVPEDSDMAVDNNPIEPEKAEVADAPENTSVANPPSQERINRSTGWQGMLMSATSLASVSYENRQRLRYCLHLLKLANTHLAATVNQLQELIQEETAAAMAQNIALNHVPPERRPTNAKSFGKYTINSIRKDITNTIGKVVTVVSTYAGNSLPEPARSHVRACILRLPSRWASSLAILTPSNPLSASSTRASSPGFEPFSPSQTPPASTEALNSPPPINISGRNSGVFSPGQFSVPSLVHSSSSMSSSVSALSMASEQHAQQVEIGGRVLMLAKEALDMLGTIISVVDETLERAEIWCDRFGRIQTAVTGRVPQTNTNLELGSNQLSPQIDSKSDIVVSIVDGSLTSSLDNPEPLKQRLLSQDIEMAD